MENKPTEVVSYCGKQKKTKTNKKQASKQTTTRTPKLKKTHKNKNYLDTKKQEKKLADL